MPFSTEARVEKLKAAILSADTPAKRLDAVEAVFCAEDWELLPLHVVEKVLDYMEVTS